MPNHTNTRSNQTAMWGNNLENTQPQKRHRQKHVPAFSCNMPCGQTRRRLAHPPQPSHVENAVFSKHKLLCSDLQLNPDMKTAFALSQDKQCLNKAKHIMLQRTTVLLYRVGRSEVVPRAEKKVFSLGTRTHLSVIQVGSI